MPRWGQSQTQTVLTGTHFDLQIGEASFNFTGNKRVGTVVNGQIPGPLSPRPSPDPSPTVTAVAPVAFPGTSPLAVPPPYPVPPAA